MRVTKKKMAGLKEKNLEETKKEMAGLKEKHLEEQQERSSLPDGGWGWMVVFGCFIVTTTVCMLGPCFGILFSRFLLERGTSSTTIAWVFNLQTLVWNLMGLPVGPLTKEFGWRKVGLFGSFLASLSIVISSFANSAEFLFFSYSILSGIGGGTVSCIVFMIIPNYFERLRGRANACMMAGVCAGQILGPPLVRHLQDEYGFQGATLITGAIILHSFVGAALFHPVEWHLVRVKGKSADIEEKEAVSFLPVDLSGNMIKSLSNVSFIATDRDAFEDNQRFLMNDAGRTVSRSSSLCSFTSGRGSSFAMSSIDLTGMAAITSIEVDNLMTTRYQGDLVSDSNDKLHVPFCTFWTVMLRIMYSTVSSVTILRSPRAMIIAFGAACTLSGYLNFVMMVPFSVQAAGHSLQSAALCLSVGAFGNLTTRFLVSVMSDWPRFNMRLVYMTGTATITLSAFVFTWVEDMTCLAVAMGVWGCGVGANMTLHNLVMIEYMGLENLPRMFGTTCLMVAVAFITVGPLIGVVRDVTGSYAISMQCTGAIVGMCFLLWMFMPAAVRYDQNKEEDKKRKEISDI